MLLAIDIGNSMVTMGVFDGERLETTLRVATDTRKLADEYGLLITNLLNLTGVEPSKIDRNRPLSFFSRHAGVSNLVECIEYIMFIHGNEEC